MPRAKKDRTFTVLVGCNTSDETRYEIGSEMKESEVSPDEIKDFLEAGAIEEK